MTPEQQRGIADFLKKYITLIADFAVLHSLLTEFERQGKPPNGWEGMWHQMQQEPEYKDLAALIQPIVDAIEKAKTETELIGLLHKLSDTPRPN